MIRTTRYELKDGWIDINEEKGAEGGNTYFGETAHAIMFEAQRLHRTNKESDYQGIVKGICEGIKNNQLTVLKGHLN